MLLFIGLGNPGEKFINTRHNVGYMIINKIHNKNDFPKFSCKLNSLISTKKVFNQKLIIAKPETYMNNSGLSVLNIKSFYNIENKNIFVFHDEIDLEIKRIKIKTGGGHNGHNGLRSIDKLIGNDYHRIKIGIGRPSLENKINKNEIISKWVLSNFLETERDEWLDNLINKICENIQFLQCKEFDKFLTFINN